jgi:C1A family cysteine protease
MGYIPSPPDLRDYAVEAFLPTHIDLIRFPVEYRVPEVVPVKDQDGVGQCVAYTLATIKQAQETREKRVPAPSYSTNFIYGDRADGDYQGDGMMPREALAELVRDGVPTEDEFAREFDGVRHPLAWVQVKAIREQYPDAWTRLQEKGKPQRILKYVRARTERQIKAALMHLGPCLIAIDVHESFFQTGKDGLIPPPSGQVVGGHAMTLIGWRADRRWVIQNSWGPGWGDRGFCYLPVNYPGIREVWTVTDQTALGAGLSDVSPDRWSYQDIQAVITAGLMQGFPDGTFRPGEPVTREQLAAVLARLLEKWGG